MSGYFILRIIDDGFDVTQHWIGVDTQVKCQCQLFAWISFVIVMSWSEMTLNISVLMSDQSGLPKFWNKEIRIFLIERLSQTQKANYLRSSSKALL